MNNNIALLAQYSIFVKFHKNYYVDYWEKQHHAELNMLGICYYRVKKDEEEEAVRVCTGFMTLKFPGFRLEFLKIWLHTSGIKSLKTYIPIIFTDLVLE